MTRTRLFTALLVLSVVAIVAAGALAGGGGGGGGTDAVAAEHVAAQGYRPWVTPLFTPGSEAAERALFGLQAALGVGVLTASLWALRRRSRRDHRVVRRDDPTTGTGAPRP